MNENILQKIALIKAKEIKLKRDTEWYWYKYATLSQIQQKLWPVFDELKIFVYHQVQDNQVITTIYDLESKESISSAIDMNTWTKAQDKWSEITYYRRYNLLALLDLETEDDDWFKAQNSKREDYVKDDDKERFNDDDFLKLAEFDKFKAYWNADDCVKAVRKKRKLSRKFEQQIRELFK